MKVKMPKIDVKKAINNGKKFGMKHKGKILLGTGIASSIGATALAGYSAIKIKGVMDQKHIDLETLDDIAKKHPKKYSKKELKEKKKKIKRDATIQAVKHAAGPVILEGISIGCNVGAYKHMEGNYMGAAAMAGVYAKEYMDLKEAITETYGEEEFNDLKHRNKKKKYSKVVKDPETGEEKIEQEEIKVSTKPNSSYDEYSRIFDSSCKGWTKDPIANRNFLKIVQQAATDKLQAQGHLLLNDVYEMLGYEKTKAGYKYGWIYTPDCLYGPNYVDFGIYDRVVEDEATARFFNGLERNVVLEFNFYRERPILDLI